MDIYVQKDGQPKGPFTETRLREGIDSGEFIPGDLAWRTGTASWQPLSKFINLDLSQPPPILEATSTPSLPAAVSSNDEGQPTEHHVVTPVEASIPPEVPGATEPLPVAQSTTLTHSPKSHPNETILFQDDKLSPPVLVSNSRLKVGDASYSLDGVTDVTFGVPSKLMDGIAPWKKPLLWILFWLITLPVFYSSCLQNASYPEHKSSLLVDTLGVWLLPGMLLFFAMRASKEDRVERYCVGEVSLIRSGVKKTVCVVGPFSQHADYEIANSLRKQGYTQEQIKERNESYFLMVEKGQAISEAVGSAIGHKPNASIS